MTVTGEQSYRAAAERNVPSHGEQGLQRLALQDGVQHSASDAGISGPRYAVSAQRAALCSQWSAGRAMQSVVSRPHYAVSGQQAALCSQWSAGRAMQSVVSGPHYAVSAQRSLG